MALRKICGGPPYEITTNNRDACVATRGPHKLQGLAACVATPDVIK